jgi:hypothetical protein
LPQVFGEVSIDLDRYHPAGVFEQLGGQRAPAGADFDHGWLGPRTHGRRDAL